MIARAATTITATVEPRAATTGILLRARTPNDEAVATADMRIDGRRLLAARPALRGEYRIIVAQADSEERAKQIEEVERRPRQAE